MENNLFQHYSKIRLFDFFALRGEKKQFILSVKLTTIFRKFSKMKKGKERAYSSTFEFILYGLYISLRLRACLVSAQGNLGLTVQCLWIA